MFPLSREVNFPWNFLDENTSKFLDAYFKLRVHLLREYFTPQHARDQ